MACESENWGQINTRKYIYSYEGSDYGKKATPKELGEADTYDDYPIGEDQSDHSSRLGEINSTNAMYSGDDEWDCAEVLDIPERCDTYDGTNVEFASSYQIADYYDGLFEAVGNCYDCDDSSEDSWGGTFEFTSGCDEGDPSYGVWLRSGQEALSISGKLFYYSSLVLYDGGSPYYWLYISCYDTNAELDIVLWEGIKYDGADHAGTYYYANGCNSDIEEITLERVT
jgi:hypothetical protein